ncbi:PadR family transcriptional regulator [Paenibacillus sp. N4]|uniref:PadR family transcriptional regulator n=1 Tax=Paenibacillus vietnamensis TaxID=2590547 RepID=UPI001CD07892|nr:PadR family transcriptional regulator [Paenibacillus vietnamensis]MCA0756163.1 PadR family transcriptional regulator [Paenibacillus vietnamensis]
MRAVQNEAPANGRLSEERNGGKHNKRNVGRGGVKTALLKLLADGPMHGYQMMKAIEEQSGGLYMPSAGSVYPTLQMLEEQGFITVKQEVRGKKTYAITPQGLSATAQLPCRADFGRARTFGSTASGSGGAKKEHDERFRRKLGLSVEGYGLLRLVTRAEQEASASKEQAAKLQRLLHEQQMQLCEFLAEPPSELE